MVGVVTTASGSEVHGIFRDWVARRPGASVEADMLARNVLT